MQEVLSKGVPFRFCARGWSMTPFIQDGDVICVSPLLHTEPGLGEVVAFTRPETEKLVVHRIIGRHRTDYRIQGDNSAGQVDGLIPKKNILGRVTRVERKGRKVWLGLGPERFLVAFLSRTKLLSPVRQWIVVLFHHFLRGIL